MQDVHASSNDDLMMQYSVFIFLKHKHGNHLEIPHTTGSRSARSLDNSLDCPGDAPDDVCSKMPLSKYY